MEKFPESIILDESNEKEVTKELRDQPAEITPPDPTLPEEPLPQMSKVLRPRHRILALMLARGDRNKDICKALGYAPSRVSILAKDPMIQAEILRIQDSIYEKTVDERMKDLSTSAVDAVEEALLPENPDSKERTATAKWVIEKLTGKAAQQVNHNGEIAIGVFIDEVKKLTSIKEQPNKIIDAQVKDIEDEPEMDDHERWLEKHLD
jgi:hypothetical protein